MSTMAPANPPLEVSSTNASSNADRRRASAGARVVAPARASGLSGGCTGTARSSALFVAASVSAKGPPVRAGALEKRLVRADMLLWKVRGHG